MDYITAIKTIEQVLDISVKKSDIFGLKDSVVISTALDKIYELNKEYNILTTTEIENK